MFSHYCLHRSLNKTKTNVLNQTFYQRLVKIQRMKKAYIFLHSNVKEDFNFLEESIQCALKYFRDVEKEELGVD